MPQGDYAYVLQLLSPSSTVREASAMRRHSAIATKSSPSLLQLEKARCSKEDPVQSKIKKKKINKGNESLFLKKERK